MYSSCGDDVKLVAPYDEIAMHYSLRQAA